LSALGPSEQSSNTRSVSSASGSRIKKISTMNKLTEGQIGYLAAMIDGEGHICLSRGKELKFGGYSYQPEVAVTNTNRTLLVWCRDTTGIGNIAPQRENLEKRKDSFIWRLSNREIVKFLTIIQPYLILKWEQADYLLDYFQLETFYGRSVTEEVSHKRKMIYEIMKDLNRRGK
jgi:hypothetical protein